jgi:hypothetical protein
MWFFDHERIGACRHGPAKTLNRDAGRVPALDKVNG